jgi:hypothetical protein
MDSVCGIWKQSTGRILFNVHNIRFLVLACLCFEAVGDNSVAYLQVLLSYSVCCRGVGAMEIVAMDMKLRGMYIARQLSFHGVAFKIEEVALSKEFVKVYDESVKLVS